MTKWSAGYQLLKSSISLVFMLFYKRIKSTGKENIPVGKPIIFAANHQNALMDPLGIIFTNPYQTMFLTRADVFNNPILLKIFTYFKMLPVYRIRDGADSLKNNERIFNKSAEILEANMSVALFPEATHTDQRRLRPLKKAVPKIAFLAEDKNNFELDLQIVPVGIYYENYVNSNSDLLINYGKPINIRKYKEIYNENNQKGYNAFKSELEDCIKPLIIHIPDEDRIVLYEGIRLLYRSLMLEKLNLKQVDLKNNFIADQNTIEKMHQYYLKEENNIDELDQNYKQLKSKSKKLKITENNLRAPGFAELLIKFIGFTIGFPIFVFGLINNYLYYKALLKLLRKVKDPQFYTSIKFVVALLIAPILYLLHSLILFAITGSGIWAIIYFLSLLFTAYFSNKYRYAFTAFKENYRIWKYSNSKNKDFLTYKELQNKLLQEIDKMM